jgi:hypothetical protein
MTYAQNFSLATPTGLEEANTLDEIIRNVKIALNERFVDILGVDLSSATDPQRVTKIVIPSAGMTIRNSSDSTTMLAVSNSAVTLGATTLSGTMTGGTLTPTTLNVPNGTSIVNASLTTPALVDAVVSGGTVAPATLTVPSGTALTNASLTGATLNNTTFTGTVSGLTTAPVVASNVRTTNVNVTTSWTTLASVTVASAGTYMLFAQITATISGLTDTAMLHMQIINNVNAQAPTFSDYIIVANSTGMARGYANCVTAIVDVASAATFSFQCYSATGILQVAGGGNNRTGIYAMKIA